MNRAFVEQVEPDDCYRAAVATLLGLRLDEVPHFFRDVRALPSSTDDDCPGVYDLIREWARARGLAPLFLPVAASLEYLLEQAERLNPGVPYILGGWNEYAGHAVVVHGGRIVHDPSPYKPGVTKPGPKGNYEVTYFTTLPPWARETGFTRENVPAPAKGDAK